MKFPIPVFFISFAVFVILLAVKRSRQARAQEDANEAFLERERLANTTRKKDISHLGYLPFSADALPSVPQDEELAKYTSVLKNLSGKRIINLSAYSNTDLKLMYGPANLNDLMEYDENYHLLSSTLLSYASRASAIGSYNDAIRILEYAMHLKIDSSQIYLLLAKLYQKQHTPEKIENIANALSAMDKSFSAHVLPKLNDFYTEK